AMISVPLIHQGRTLAFLLLFYVRQPLPGPAELRPLAELAPLLAAALSRERLLASSAQARKALARLRGEAPAPLLKRSPLLERALWALLFLIFVPVPFRVGGEALLAPMRQHFCYADLAGTIERVLVQQGDPVEKGQLLTTLDDRELAFEVRRKSREVDRVAAEIELLRNQGAGEAEKLVDLELAILEHRRQEGELRFLEGSRDRLEIRSPVKGIVITERVARLAGRRFQAGELFCKVAPTEEMDVVLGIPESDAGFIEASQPLQVLFRPFPRQPLELSVARISPIARSSPEQGNILEVRSPYSGQIQGLRPGMGGYGHVFVGWRCLGYVMFRKAFGLLARPLML
ncbi:MAG: efflux RND transporter periplasmic adaptor subunit, partial [Planctomycetota bacterium]